MTIEEEARLTDEECKAIWHKGDGTVMNGIRDIADAATAKALRVLRERVRAMAVSSYTAGHTPESLRVLWRCKLCRRRWREGRELHSSDCLLWEASDAG